MMVKVDELSRSLDGRRVLILDHAIIVNRIPVHGPGLNMYATLQAFKPESVEYVAHCLNNENRTYDAKWDMQGASARFRGLPLRWLPRCVGFLYCMVYSVLAFMWRRHDLCIAVNPLNFISAFVLQMLGRVDKTILYSADYSEKRFNSCVLDDVYHRLDRFALRHADQVWSVSHAICSLRRTQGVPEDRNWHMPNGPVMAQFTPLKDEEIARHQIVYVFGAITRASDLMVKHHFDWVFKALEVLVAKDNRIRLLLIGRGDFRGSFQAILPESLASHVLFLDIEDRASLVKKLCESAIGIALYDLSGADHLRYGDSMKLREYFAAGMPSITTPGHSVAVEVAEHNLGAVVGSAEECLEALDGLLHDDDSFFAMRRRVLAYAQATDKAVLAAVALARLLPGKR
jgi:glycosyltransferase involved in cell wall biosynthesis